MTTVKREALALLSNCRKIITQDTSDLSDLEILVRALQAFKDGTLAHVYTRPTDLPDKTQRHQLFSVRFEDLAFLAPRLQKYLKRRGIRYIGEVFYVYFDPRSKTAGAHCDEILGALNSKLAIPREIDPLMDGWTPPYWENPTFRQMLSTPVIQVLGDRSFNRAGRSFIGYTSTARWIHKGGDHYIGAWMQNLRAATSSKPGNPTNAWGAGKLEDLQTTLNRVPELWAAALIPPDWHAPEGVPEIWTHLLEAEILPAIAAQEEQRRQAQERRQALNRKREPSMQADAGSCDDQLVATNLDNLRKRVDELELSVRSANCLSMAGIEYVWQLCQYTESQLLKIKNFGRKNLSEIKEVLVGELWLELGLTFSEDALKLLNQRQ